MKNRCKPALILFVALIGVMFLMTGVGTVAAQYAPDCSTVTYNGDGTSANPYEVSNVNQLQCIEDQGLNLNYRLVSDIDASETSLWNSRKGFKPIGERSSSGTPFEGTFDGDGHEITDLTINRPSEVGVALFDGVGVPGTVTDVSVVEVSVTGDNLAGSLVGVNEGTVSDSSASGDVAGDSTVGHLIGRNEGTVSNSSASGDVTGENRVGGLVGWNYEGTVSNSSASGDVTGSTRVGGLVGINEGTVSNSSASGNVTGFADVGGLAGLTFEGTVSESSASGNVEGNTTVGGLVGDLADPVSESSAFGDVEGDERVGGFVGENGGTIEKSYARGNATGNVSVGGLVGKNEDTGSGDTGTVSESYATGKVTGPFIIPDPSPGPISTQDSSSTVGGLVGNNSAGTVTESYWDVNTTGYNTSDGGTGLTTEEMISDAAADNMTGFDFTSTWKTVSGNYPILTWQSQTGGGGSGPSLNDYRDNPSDPTSEVSLSGLQDAINDFTQGNISLSLLQDVINEFIAS